MRLLCEDKLGGKGGVSCELVAKFISVLLLSGERDGGSGGVFASCD